MNLGKIENLIVKARPQLEAVGVAHIALFGSRVRGDCNNDSDVDILIDIVKDKKFSLIDLVGVERILSKAVGLKAQATMRRSLSEAFSKRILPDIREVF